MTPIDRVQKLIALTSSPHEEEARTAAIQACRLIREYGLIIAEKVGERPGYVIGKGRVSRMRDTYGNDFSDMLRDLVQEQVGRHAPPTPKLYPVWTYSDFPAVCFPDIAGEQLGCSNFIQPKTWRLVYHEGSPSGPGTMNLCQRCGEKVKPLGTKERDEHAKAV